MNLKYNKMEKKKEMKKEIKRQKKKKRKRKKKEQQNKKKQKKGLLSETAGLSSSSLSNKKNCGKLSFSSSMA